MPKILVVDDNAASRELLRHILKGSCEEVIEASRGDEALDAVQAARPDLILMDLEMPGIDGYGVLLQLRRDPCLAAVKIVAVTASAMQGDRERALAAGFDGYVTKPVDAVELRRYVRQLLDTTE